MIKVAYTNIQSKIKINGPLSDLFTSLVLYIMAAEVLANFIDAN